MIKLVSPSEVDEALAYPVGKSERLARAGKLPHVKLPDGSVRFDPSEIQQLIEAAKRPAPRTEATVNA